MPLDSSALDVGISLGKVVLGGAKGRNAISRLHTLSNNELYSGTIKSAIKPLCIVPLISDDETKR